MTLRRELQAGQDASGEPVSPAADTAAAAIQEALDIESQVARQAEQIESLEAERNSLMSIASSLRDEVDQLRHALSEAAATAGDGMENIVIEAVDRMPPDDDPNSISRERDELRERLQSREKGEAELRATIESLRTQLAGQEAAAAAQADKLGRALEQEQQRLAVLQTESATRDAQLESVRVETSQKEVDLEVLHDELEVARQRIADLQKLVEAGDDRVKSLEVDYQDSARKSHEDLKRKNDIEKEMQGQIDRLRKQLEQTSRDYQKARAGAQEDLDHLRDELHAERQARAEERAQMAARQRELKEQLAAIATEHEHNFSKQSDVIEEAVQTVRVEERSRLQGVLDAHAATEEQLAKVQQDLQQAHAEMVMFRHQERERHQADIKLMEGQYRQAESTIKQLESQLRQLTGERDEALEEQNALHEKINTLRGEVEVTRGLMNAAVPGQTEDPARLRKQLEETRRNVEIAVRLRAEAEAARDRLLNERDALIAQFENGSSAAAPLLIPSLESGFPSASPARPGHVTGTVLPGSGGASPAAAMHTTVTVPGAAGRRMPGWLGGLAGLLVAGAIAAGGWWLVGAQAPGPQDELRDAQAVVLDVSPAIQSAGDKTMVPGQIPVPAQVSPPPVRPDPRLQSGPSAELQEMTEPRVDPSTVRQQTVVPARQDRKAAVTPGAGAQDVTASGGSSRQASVRTFRDTLKSGGEGPVMVELARAGYFMGSYGNSLNFEEGPRHLVKLPGFAIAGYEVTFDEYDRFARATGRRLPYDESWGRGNRPVINVSWHDARAYADWLSEQTGHTYRLPTEAEWEYAARGGSYWLYWWMAAEDAEITDGVWANCHNCGSEWDGVRTAPVGQFSANPYGLYDMTGNVQEWIADCYNESYEGAPEDGSAWLRPHCSQRVVRGGGYTSPLDTLRSAKRGQLDQDTRLDNLGFRVVREN